MRLLIFAGVLLGVVFMSDVVVADEPKSPADAKNYDLVCTVRTWDGKKFLKPIANRLAMKGEISGKMVIYTKPESINTKTPKGSEITIGDDTYVVEKVTEGDSYHINYVKLKAKDK